MLSCFLVGLTLEAFGYHMRRLAILQLQMKRPLGATSQRGVSTEPQTGQSSAIHVFSAWASDVWVEKLLG